MENEINANCICTNFPQYWDFIFFLHVLVFSRPPVIHHLTKTFTWSLTSSTALMRFVIQLSQFEEQSKGAFSSNTEILEDIMMPTVFYLTFEYAIVPNQKERNGNLQPFPQSTYNQLQGEWFVLYQKL